jgi:hypothetical protein
MRRTEMGLTRRRALAIAASVIAGIAFGAYYLYLVWEGPEGLGRLGRTEECKSRQHVIAMAVDMYAVDNGGHLPKTLEALVPRYIEQPSWLVCPETGERYIYFFERREVWREQLSPMEPLTADVGFPHLGRGCDGLKVYVACDGHPVLVSMRELAARLDREPNSLAGILGPVTGQETEPSPGRAPPESAPAAAPKKEAANGQ